MSVRCLFYVVFLGTVYCYNSDNFNITVEYYEKVIKHGQREAYSSPLPTNAYDYIPTSKDLKDYGTFDYIIVGGGSTGSVIATRLSEERNFRILLLEAGDYETSFSDIPGFIDYVQGLPFNWNFKSVRQTTSCLGMVNNQCPIPRGKGLGGSSIINALMYTRGNKIDYDTWEKNSNPGWSYKDVLPYFIKSENSQIDGDPGYHGKGGLLNVEYYKPYNPKLYAFIDANIELGRKIVDYNGKEQLGVARTQINNFSGRRGSIGKFLLYAQNRENLKILTNSLVTKVLIDEKKKEARGVLFSHEHKSFVAWGSKEVIISAGTISSPQLLMLSGIGPAAHLRQFGIPVIKNLAVGELQDHVTFRGLWFTSNYAEPTKSLSEDVKDFLKDSGRLSIAQNSQGIGFFQTNLTNISGLPDIEAIMIPSNGFNDVTQYAFQYTNETYHAVFGQMDPTRAFTMLLVALHPQSRGVVKLQSANPYDYPLIDPRLLSDPRGDDIETLYVGIQMILEMIGTSAFKKLNASLVDVTLPACKKYDYLSKAYWYCQIRQLSLTMFHPVGTCRMGPNPAMGDVVNHQLQVHGITKLRVADASIIPSITSGHTNAPSIMIGEKLSDMIRKRHAHRCSKDE